MKSVVIKMYQSDPHRVISSVKLNAQGKAVGYFIDDKEHPGFELDIYRELYEQIVLHLNRFHQVNPEYPNQDDYLFAFIINTYGANARTDAFYIPFSEAEIFADICEGLTELFKEGRKHSL